MYTTALEPTLRSNNSFRNTAREGLFKRLVSSYSAYCVEHGKEKMYWFMKAIIIIPCVLMPPSIIAFYMTGVSHEIYIGFCMVLFYCNVIGHVAELPSRYYIPIYHMTIALMIAIPAITYFISMV